ncbi:protein ELF4-LIKE 2 [Arabidopsis lyrata subsp. lyrata]|uniref:protein ELF4-LIKE 2 n=1 Tax=Arabidopsis lyrata subsp. lyrata TaxID=81972 RepID=UPI000A29BB82|nr:protein ELF4-LIKE 2 [Arabidopsis lyrata subsp. lyrata]|eukprot:XP_020889740.1 protein ELF4-LIKE 2 [Arabidopsis lyrata subsp. lyrata]
MLFLHFNSCLFISRENYLDFLIHFLFPELVFFLKNKINIQDLSLMESRMEGDVYSGFGERYQMDGKLLQNFQKSFVQVQDILDQNRLLINEINQNHESKQADHLGRNVGLIRELNNNIRTVASLYGDLSHSFARSIDASSEGESTGTLKSDGKANNQKRFRSG